MDIIVGAIISFTALIFSIYKGIFIGFPILISLIIFSIIAIRKGHDLNKVIRMAYEGGKVSFIVIKILILIGIITASWMASGTVPGMVYYGIKFMNPKFFIVYSFIISTVVSYILGTAFGAVGTIGVSLMVMARAGGINPNIAAGAIIGGSCFGDRCSPMSSSAHLIANLTDTNIYGNLKNMFKTSIIPYGISLLLYIFISLKYPLNFKDSGTTSEILRVFNINILVLLPAFLILILSGLKVNVKISMLLSAFAAFLIAYFYQGVSFKAFLRYIVLGYNIDVESSLGSIIKGGGILSMAKAIFIIFVSCSLAGVLENAGMLDNVHKLFEKVDSRYGLLVSTALISVFAAAFGGNQSIAIVLTNQVMKGIYDKLSVDKYQLAVDIENTAVVISPLIPWNISGLIPATTLNVGNAVYLPYAFYLYLIPLVNILYLRFFNRNKIAVHQG